MCTSRLPRICGVSHFWRNLTTLVAHGVERSLWWSNLNRHNNRLFQTPKCTRSRRANQWHFGMKAHISVDAKSGLIHIVRGTSCNVSDIAEANCKLHGQDSVAFGDADYQGVENDLMPTQTLPGTLLYAPASAKRCTTSHAVAAPQHRPPRCRLAA